MSFTLLFILFSSHLLSCLCLLSSSFLSFTLSLFLSGPLPDPHMMASGEKLKDIHPQPGLCKLLHGLENLNLVDSKFGPVPFGSVLSYQCPPEISKDCIRHPDAPAFPQLPVDGYNFKFPANYELSYKQQCHLESLKVCIDLFNLYFSRVVTLRVLSVHIHK